MNSFFSPVFSTNFPARVAYQVAALPKVSKDLCCFLLILTWFHSNLKAVIWIVFCFSRVDWLKLRQLLFWALWATDPNKYRINKNNTRAKEVTWSMSADYVGPQRPTKQIYLTILVYFKPKSILFCRHHLTCCSCNHGVCNLTNRQCSGSEHFLFSLTLMRRVWRQHNVFSSCCSHFSYNSCNLVCWLELPDLPLPDKLRTVCHWWLEIKEIFFNKNTCIFVFLKTSWLLNVSQCWLNSKSGYKQIK